MTGVLVCVCVCVSVQSLSRVQLFATFRAKSLQLCLTLCDPMDCSLPGFSVQGILQVRRGTHTHTHTNRKYMMQCCLVSSIH